MRILYLTEGFTVHDRRFLTKLGESGHEIVYIPLYSERAPVLEDLPPGITAAALGPQPLATNAEQVAAIERAASEIKPDIVQAGPLTSCAYLAALVGLKPLVSMSYAYDILWEGAHDIEAMNRVKVALSASAGLLCDSRAVEEAAIKLSARPDLPIARFPWGIDLEHFRYDHNGSSMREDLGWSQHTVVVSNRSWEPLYQVPLAVKSFALAQSVVPKLRMILISSGSENKVVQQEIDARGVRDFVHLPGRISQDRLPAYLNASDIYLSCSLTDGASISLLEAMACELPVVVTDLPSNREWIGSGTQFNLCDPHSAEAFASALIQISSFGADERRARGRDNRHTVEQRANWHRNFPLLLDFYDRVLASLGSDQ